MTDNIASGGFGTVFRAKKIRVENGVKVIERLVAVKLYKTKVSSETELDDLFSITQEASLIKNNPHPLVIKYEDSFRDSQERAYLVTELAEGKDLKTLMKERFNSAE